MFATTSYRVLGALSKLELSSACTNAIRQPVVGKISKLAGKSTSFTERLLSSAAAASDSYHYILVGGGTASCVLAKRLLETNPGYKILVLEAGSPDFEHKHIKIPAGK